jgi:aspartyl-tRNA(Asn)/glutamyl-tRNA(Gln) amidotransferase subunit C
MALQRDDVAKIARLSRIAMSDEELDRFAEQLSRIVTYFDKLNELDTADVEPLSHALPVANVFRDDEPQPSLPPEAAVANAPDRSGTMFKVPRVLDEGLSA